MGYGDKMTLGPYTLICRSYTADDAPNYASQWAVLDVYRRGKQIDTMTPVHRFYKASQPRVAWSEYNGSIMTSYDESHAVLEICANVKRLGYAASCHVRLYGEDFDVLSDPFPEEGGVAVRAKAKKDSRLCVLRLPSTVLQSVGRSRKAA